MTIEPAISFARTNREEFIHDLMEFIRIPSVSTQPQRAPDILRAADWLVNRLKKLGFQTRLLETGGPPAVYGELRAADPSAPMLLLYGHYDVQPAEPLEEWSSPPFEPEVRGENLFGRGASDMKGPLMAYLAALESAIAAGPMPVSIKTLFEGEEEVGSPHLAELMARERELLACDAVLNGDTLLLQPDMPTIIYGLRGLAYFELRVETAAHDLHSGLFGGASPNAGQILCDLIAGMHDPKGRVTLPHFYDDVVPLENEERRELARIPFDPKEFLSQTTGLGIIGEEGYTATERVMARPTLEVNGLLCGFTEEGSKTVLPARAMAKISMRLVPAQKAERVKAQLEAYLAEHAPAWLKWEVIDLAGGPAAIVRRDTPTMRAAIRALEAAFGAPVMFAREGGSVPVVSLFQDLLGKESIMMGISLPDDNLHAPNEKLHLPSLARGIEAYLRFFYELAR